MKARHHIAISGIVALLLYVFLRNVTLTITAFLYGFLIDLDHVLDYVLTHRLPTDLKHFFRVFYEGHFDKVYIMLHAWEWYIALGVGVWLSGWHPMLTGIFIGAMHHLLADQIYNHPHPLGYSFIWRCSRRFSYRMSFPHTGTSNTPPAS